MKLPETEKHFPAMRRAAIAFAFAVLSGMSWAGADEDYAAGAAAYRENDVVTAMGHLKKAADLGHAPAQALYGELLDSADMDAEAADYYRKAALQDNAAGMYGLAKLYLTGEFKTIDSKEASRLMRTSAAKGNDQAILAMAQAYIAGDARLEATDQATPEARDYVLKAAGLSDLVAMRAVADAYRSGKFGFEINADRAKEWEGRIAAQGPKRKGSRK